MIDDNGVTAFVDDNSVTIWIDDNSVVLGGRQFTIHLV